MYAFAVLSIAVLAGQTAATPVAGAASLVALLKRQGTPTLDPGSIPAQCESQCGAAINSINTCTDINCLCSDTVNKGLYNCFECGLSLQPDPSLMSSAQSSLTQFENTCNQAGVPGVQLTSLTLTMPNGPPPTGSGSSGSPSTAAGSYPTGTATVPAGTVNTALPAPTNPAPVATSSSSSGSNPNPLARNDARMVGVSAAFVAGAAGVAMAVLV